MASSKAIADVVVVGLGAFGSATTYQLARRGADVIGLDRFRPPHDRGSSHGETRITRLAVGEGEDYAPLVKRSHQIWRQLEYETGGSLYVATGGLILGGVNGFSFHHGRTDFVQSTIDVSEKFGIAHEVLDASEIRRRFPQFLVSDSDRAYYEPAAGLLRAESCVATQIAAARSHGARIRDDERVIAIEADGNVVLIRTDKGTYSAARAIVAAGSWIPQLIGGEFARLKVMRQVLYWFKVTEPELYQPGVCPVFVWPHGASEEEHLYGFPMVDGRNGVKVASEQYQSETDPDDVTRTVSDSEISAMHTRNVAGLLRSITDECVYSTTCLYTVSPDSGFVIDKHPFIPGVTVVSACSGHGFKHSAAVGEALALEAMGKPTSVNWGAFSAARLAS